MDTSSRKVMYELLYWAFIQIRMDSNGTGGPAEVAAVNALANMAHNWPRQLERASTAADYDEILRKAWRWCNPGARPWLEGYVRRLGVDPTALRLWSQPPREEWGRVPLAAAASLDLDPEDLAQSHAIVFLDGDDDDGLGPYLHAEVRLGSGAVVVLVKWMPPGVGVFVERTVVEGDGRDALDLIISEVMATFDVADDLVVWRRGEDSPDATFVRSSEHFYDENEKRLRRSL